MNVEISTQRSGGFHDSAVRQQIIFVDGHSSDGTPEEVRRLMACYPGKDIKLLVQDSKGKGDAVRKGFAHATGDVLMILDADLTMPPEALPKFYEAIANGKGEFINGCRLVYPMESQAMRVLNLIGNKFFGLAFSWILNQRIKDTLCGTKVLFRHEYERIAANRHYFGDFDPFGDFDLLFGASKLNLHIVEIPIRLSRPGLRQHQYSAICPRMVVAENDGLWIFSTEGRVMSEEVLHRHRAVWQQKPVLRRLYEGWYRDIIAWLVPGRTVEIGGGTGNLKAHVPEVYCSDVMVLPWLNVVADAQRLPFQSESLSNLVLFDSLHHIENVSLFFR